MVLGAPRQLRQEPGVRGDFLEVGLVAGADQSRLALRQQVALVAQAKSLSSLIRRTKLTFKNLRPALVLGRSQPTPFVLG